MPNVSTYTNFTLDSTSSVATLDYGFEVAGYPFFEVLAVNGTVQIEVKYSEPFAGLTQPFSDGPFPYAVGLSNSYRVETFIFNDTGLTTAFLLQGGQRWQSIRLLTNNSITFGQLGFKASIAPIDIDNLPGQFNCSNDIYNEIWKLGARAVSAACVEVGSQDKMWEISEDDGAFVRGMRPALSTYGQDFEDYTLNFHTKIARGGAGWVVVRDLRHESDIGLIVTVLGRKPWFDLRWLAVASSR
jgi:hypothetical protein